MSSGAGIIFWYNSRENPIILVGKESVYISDLINDDPTFAAKFGELVSEKQEFNTSSLSSMSDEAKLKEAKKVFSRRAESLKEILDLGLLKFDTPQKTETGYRVNFRYLPLDFKRGIIKGKSDNNETPLETVLREVGEELGINISEREQNKMVNLGDCGGYTIFSLQVDRSFIEFVGQRVKERLTARSGEIYDFTFKPLSEIETLLNNFNSKSKCAINEFKRQILPTIIRRGGRSRKTRKTKRKTRKMKQTRRHKNHY